MELPRRKADDVYLPDGEFRRRVHALQQLRDSHDLAVGIAYAFDFRTRMLPYWYADKRMAPCSVRLLGDVLHEAGFENLRVVLQQWSPNVLPSRMQLGGKPLDILLVSSMQVHAERANELIRDAHRMGDSRPLILAGGPKAIYEPTDFLEIGPEPGIGADCVVTGEAYVLLELLHTILADRHANQTALEAFEQSRQTGGLNAVPGLVYLSADAHVRAPVAVNTGVQRLVRDLDELPMPDAGYRMIEPPHRRRKLSARPCPPDRVGKLSTIASVISTQGCRFNCSYCPIPAVNQRTWRHKSPQRLAAEIKHIHENFGISDFFSTDDNFFNDRQTVIELMTEMSQTEVAGRPLSECIRFFTEATEFDVYKNRDLLPLCRKGGLAAIWFGIEDIAAELVNKGQNAGKTDELFALLHKLDIEPMAMMIHSDDQPLRSPRDDLTGLLNQARYLFERGAVSYQCTYLGPAVGTRDFEPAAKAGAIFKSVGRKAIPQAYQDGNHVVASKHPRPWSQQLNVLRAYAAFYNPWNALRALVRVREDSLGPKRLLFQFVGLIGLLLTVPRLLAWAWRLKRGPIEAYDGLAMARIPMVDAASSAEINWAIENVPSLELARHYGDQTMPVGGTFTAAELTARLGGALEGDGASVITTVSALDQATPDSLSWVGDLRYVSAVSESRAGVILVAYDCPPLPGRTIIRVADPDVAILHVLGWLAPPRDAFAAGVDPTARVHSEAEVAGAMIGAHVSVDAGAVVGAGAQLHHGVHIGAMTRIGRNCELWSNVVVRERVTIGDRVAIHPNTTIGADGFGYLQRNGEHLKIPQIGTVEIEDDVEIGANCTIDRARSGVTRIGRGTKIDNLVQIGHNVEVGPGCMIVAQCGIGGSTHLGRSVVLGGQVAVFDHVHVGDGVRVAAKSLVTKSIKNSKRVRGIPAVDNYDFMRQQAGVRKLPVWVNELKKLRDQVQELESKITEQQYSDLATDESRGSNLDCGDLPRRARRAEYCEERAAGAR